MRGAEAQERRVLLDICASLFVFFFLSFAPFWKELYGYLLSCPLSTSLRCSSLKRGCSHPPGAQFNWGTGDISLLPFLLKGRNDVGVIQRASSWMANKIPMCLCPFPPFRLRASSKEQTAEWELLPVSLQPDSSWPWWPSLQACIAARIV